MISDSCVRRASRGFPFHLQRRQRWLMAQRFHFPATAAVFTGSPKTGAPARLESFGSLTKKNPAQWQPKAASCRASVPVLILCAVTSAGDGARGGGPRTRLCTGAFAASPASKPTPDHRRRCAAAFSAPAGGLRAGGGGSPPAVSVVLTLHRQRRVAANLSSSPGSRSCGTVCLLPDRAGPGAGHTTPRTLREEIKPCCSGCDAALFYCF